MKRTILSRPLTALASRRDTITASVPVLQKATRSAPVNSWISSATSPATLFWGPSSNPASSCSRTARTTKSGWWPKKWTP